MSIFRLMYLSSSSYIIRAEMDGSNVVRRFFRVDEPRGIFFNPEDSRLYLTSAGDKKIISCNVEGGDQRDVVRLHNKAHPQGVAVLNNRLYWTDHFDGKLESSRMDGSDRRILDQEAGQIMHVVPVQLAAQNQARPNHCDGGGGKADPCDDDSICVLTAASFNCTRYT